MLFTKDFRDLLEASNFLYRLKTEKRILMDNTEFTNWNSCLVKGFYFGGVRKIPAGGATPLLFGQAVHTGLKHLLLGEMLDYSIRKAIEDATKSNLDSYMDPKRNINTLIELLTSYDAHVKIVPAERIVPIERNGERIVEKSFSLLIGTLHFAAGELFSEAIDIQVYWTGLIDVIGNVNGEPWIVDHKTTSVMGPKFADTYLRSSQMLGYTHVARTIAEELGITLGGVLINALAHRSSGFEFQQFRLPMAKWKIEEWHTETLLAIKNIVLQTVDFLVSGEVVPNREHCVTKYGRCPYFDLCESVPTIRDRNLKDSAFFIDNTWDPNAQ